MSFFSSDRERRLWLWALIVTIAIYASLGFARSWAGILRERNLLDGAFAFGFLIMIVAIVALRVRTRPGAREIAVLVGVVAVYLLTFVRMAIPEERTHLVEYGLLGVLIHEALSERARQGRRVRRPALLAISATAVLGLVDECAQNFLPGRVFDPRDVLFNALAGSMAVGASAALTWARRSKAASE